MLPQAVEKITLSSQVFATKSGKRLFIPVNIFNQLKSIPARVDKRMMPLYLGTAYLDKDSVRIQLPNGFKAETIPQGKRFSTEFGDYSTSVRLENNTLFFVRIFKANRGIWTKEKYAGFVDFYTFIFNADKAKIVLKEE